MKLFFSCSSVVCVVIPLGGRAFIYLFASGFSRTICITAHGKRCIENWEWSWLSFALICLQMGSSRGVYINRVLLHLPTGERDTQSNTRYGQTNKQPTNSQQKMAERSPLFPNQKLTELDRLWFLFCFFRSTFSGCEKKKKQGNHVANSIYI